MISLKLMTQKHQPNNVFKQIAESNNYKIVTVYIFSRKNQKKTKKLNIIKSIKKNTQGKQLFLAVNKRTQVISQT